MTAALTLSRDRKVAPIGMLRRNGQWAPTVHNSFGLPPGPSCPGRTSFCDDCYAVNAEKYGGVAAALARNFATLQEAGSVNAMAELLITAVGQFADQADRRELSAQDRIFRIHWSGDFYSVDYARAWRKVVKAFPEISFWAYTRSFREPVNVVPFLARLSNLKLYLSVDVDNAEDARRAKQYHPWVHLALCGETPEAARSLSFARAASCPENTGQLAVMADGRGACAECRLCVVGRGDVVFALKRRGRLAVASPAIVRHGMSGYKRGCGCEVCQAAQRAKTRRQREQRRACAPPRVQRTTCRHGHLLPGNVVAGTPRCLTCNRQRQWWHAAGLSLTRTVAAARAYVRRCGLVADLTWDQWEEACRRSLFPDMAWRNVMSITLLPDDVLWHLVEIRMGFGVDSLGRPVLRSEAWL